MSLMELPKAEMEMISSDYDRKLVNRAIRIPDVLYSKDGREFPIRVWDTHIEQGSMVMIAAEMFVKMGVGDADPAPTQL